MVMIMSIIFTLSTIHFALLLSHHKDSETVCECVYKCRCKSQYAILRAVTSS